ncbi:MAG: tRNA-dihydrouridine synthase family protein [Candidatus Omnitrophica bacterium]|nr:tRNA-dihydrouridine synthase family protein [Candidatus Omnitrophota bacterium]
MAPIQGITGALYRNAYSRHFDGYNYAVTPFIKSSIGRRSTLRDILPEKIDTRFEIVPQVLDRHAAHFITLAKAIFDLGYDTLNWNLGCPLPMVRKKGRGAGMLPLSGEILAFLEKVVPNIPNKLSIKVRLGSENPKDLTKLLPLINGIPLKEIIIHPRTGTQMYTGNADLDAFEEALGLTTHNVVYSGDIDSVKKFEKLLARFPEVSGWMIGRYGITDPFLPEKIKVITGRHTLDEKSDRFRSFHDTLFAAYKKELSGPGHLIGKMKEVWLYWSAAFDHGDKLFHKIARTKTADKYRSVVDEFFDARPKLKI